MRRPPITAALLIASLALAAPAAAQTGEAPSEPPPPPLSLNIESIDASNHPAMSVTVGMPRDLVGAELEADAFTVLENGEPRPAAVELVPSDDLQVVLVLDTSGSMRGEPLAAAKVAALNFVELMPEGVQIAVVGFGDTPAIISEFSTDKPALTDAILGLEVRGETALYDALVVAGAQFDPEQSARRTVVLLSDGGDTASAQPLETALISLLDAGAAFYAVELESPENDRATLERIAVASQGTVVRAADPGALDEIFDEIASQLVNRYRLTYESAAFTRAGVAIEVATGDLTASGSSTVRLPSPPPPPVAPPTTLAQRPVPTTTLPPLREGVTVELAWWETTAALYLALGAVFLAMVGFFLAAVPRVKRTTQLTIEGVPVKWARSKSKALAGLADRATDLAQATLERGDRFNSLNTLLERAGVDLRPAEFAVLTSLGFVAVTVVGSVLFAPAIGLGLGALVLFSLRMWLGRKAEKRTAAFGDQLTDTLQLMAGSMRAGFGLLQSVDAVAQEAPSPTAEEFNRIKVETHLGRDLNDALHAMAKRVDSEDFEWVAEAIQIHREIGGDLAQILDSVNETIRDRNRIKRRIKALSAEGRISAIILSIIPIALLFIIQFINPAYLAELPNTGMGQVMIVGGIVGWIVGIAWMKNIIKLRF